MPPLPACWIRPGRRVWVALLATLIAIGILGAVLRRQSAERDAYVAALVELAWVEQQLEPSSTNAAYGLLTRVLGDPVPVLLNLNREPAEAQRPFNAFVRRVTAGFGARKFPSSRMQVAPIALLAQFARTDPRTLEAARESDWLWTSQVLLLRAGPEDPVLRKHLELSMAQGDDDVWPVIHVLQPSRDWLLGIARTSLAGADDRQRSSLLEHLHLIQPFPTELAPEIEQLSQSTNEQLRFSAWAAGCQLSPAHHLRYAHRFLDEMASQTNRAFADWPESIHRIRLDLPELRKRQLELAQQAVQEGPGQPMTPDLGHLWLLDLGIPHPDAVATLTERALPGLPVDVALLRSHRTEVLGIIDRLERGDGGPDTVWRLRQKVRADRMRFLLE